MDDFEGFGMLTPAEQQRALLRPALSAPEGMTSQLDNPPNQTDMGRAVTILCTVVGGVALLLRIYSTFLSRSRLRLEDALGTIATGTFVGVLYVGYGFANINGFYVHQWDLDHHQFSRILYLSYLLSSFYCLTMLFTKSAILLEWIHIFVPNRKRNSFYWISIATITLNAVYFISAFIFIQFQCKPRQKIWDRWIDGSCTNRGVVDKISGYVNIALDIVIFFLPQRIIWKLHTSLKRKIGLSVVFGIGLLGIGCATGRAHNNHTLDFHGDVTYSMAQAYLWAVGECSVGILIYCMPVIPRVFTELKSRTNMFTAQGKGRSTTSGRELYRRDKVGSHSAGHKTSRVSSDPHTTMYRMMDEGNSEIQLTHLDATRKGSIPDDTDDGFPDLSQGILRTTEIRTEISVEAAAADVAKPPAIANQDWVKQQHPWMAPKEER